MGIASCERRADKQNTNDEERPIGHSGHSDTKEVAVRTGIITLSYRTGD